MFVLAVAFFGLNMYFSSSDVVIYMYHSVRETPVNPQAAELSVRPAEFEKQLRYFNSRHFKTVFASELAGLDPRNSRYAALTFDDGYADNYTEVFPLLKKYNCKATIFVISSLIGVDGYLSADQIREMTQSGLVSIQSHTVTHYPLAMGNLVYEEVDLELGQSKLDIEKISGIKVDAVAMPNGSYDETVLDIAKKYYSVIFTGTDLRPYHSGELRDIHRVGIYRRHSIDDVRRMTGSRGLYLLKQGLKKLLGMQ